MADEKVRIVLEMTESEAIKFGTRIRIDGYNQREHYRKHGDPSRLATSELMERCADEVTRQRRQQVHG